MNITELKIGSYLKKNKSTIELKVTNVGNEWQSGYDFVELYNDVTGFTEKIVDVSNYSKIS